MNYSNISGYNIHRCFGLRREWLALCLAEPETWQESQTLGNRQVESLRVWLRTAGLVDRQGQRTHLWELFQQEGVDSLLAWEELWVNVVFQFPTARWYVERRGLGAWTVSELQALLQQEVPRLGARTAYNALLELVGLLERTPVGQELGQGTVTPSRPRLVSRGGYPHPDWPAVSWALERLFREGQRVSMGLAEELLWPWLIFGCAKQVIVQQLLLHPSGPFRFEGTQLRWVAAVPERDCL